MSVCLYWEEMKKKESEDACPRLVSDKDDSGIVFCTRNSAAVQLGRSIINAPVFVFACFGAN